MAKLSDLWEAKHEVSVAVHHTLYSDDHRWYRKTGNGFEYGFTELYWHFRGEVYPYETGPEDNPFLEVDDIEIDEERLYDVAEYRELVKTLLQF